MLTFVNKYPVDLSVRRSDRVLPELKVTSYSELSFSIVTTVKVYEFQSVFA